MVSSAPITAIPIKVFRKNTLITPDIQNFIYKLMPDIIRTEHSRISAVKERVDEKTKYLVQLSVLKIQAFAVFSAFVCEIKILPV